MLKGMIRAALGVADGKNISYQDGQKQAWWPHGVRNSTDFKEFVKGRRGEAQQLYADLQALLAAQAAEGGVARPAPGAAGNVSSFGGKVLRGMRSMLRTKQLAPEP